MGSGGDLLELGGGQEKSFLNQPTATPTGRIAGRSNAFNQNLSVEGLICNLWAPEIARGMYVLVSSSNELMHSLMYIPYVHT